MAAWVPLRDAAAWQWGGVLNLCQAARYYRSTSDATRCLARKLCQQRWRHTAQAKCHRVARLRHRHRATLASQCGARGCNGMAAGTRRSIDGGSAPSARMRSQAMRQRASEAPRCAQPRVRPAAHWRVCSDVDSVRCGDSGRCSGSGSTTRQGRKSPTARVRRQPPQPAGPRQRHDAARPAHATRRWSTSQLTRRHDRHNPAYIRDLRRPTRGRGCRSASRLSPPHRHRCAVSAGRMCCVIATVR